MTQPNVMDSDGKTADVKKMSLLRRKLYLKNLLTKSPTAKILHKKTYSKK